MTERKKVLIIDDEQGIRDMLSMVLLMNNFESLCACDGETAALLAERTCFDVIISDYSMPGMNGAEVIRKVRALCPRSFIIGISAGANRTAFLEAGADTFLRKPFSPDDLLALLLPLSL
ncbi:MAG: response regulator [Alphaproteobacteria bacterium]|uniref:Response regulator n=1 Tax=Candidatus Nitrobium versatile TaxID=2884831 RepID=A0A953SD35_9BACT|nr:response regulator [Candidatus Nitrobium versatile]